MACGHELLVHGLDDDGAATAVQAGAVRDLANVLHLAMRSCRQEQEHACAAEHPFSGDRRGANKTRFAAASAYHNTMCSSGLRRQCCIISEPRTCGVAANRIRELPHKGPPTKPSFRESHLVQLWCAWQAGPERGNPRG